jgi:DNA-binding CsgD family transcriptional regulator
MHPPAVCSDPRNSPVDFACSGISRALFIWNEAALQEAIRTQGAAARAGSEIGSEILSPREVEVLELLGAHHKLSARELGERLGISQRAIEKHLSALQQRGRLRRLGSPRSGSWQVLPPSHCP